MPSCPLTHQERVFLHELVTRHGADLKRDYDAPPDQVNFDDIDLTILCRVLREAI